MIFFFQAEDGIRDVAVTGVQTCALPISLKSSGLLTWTSQRALVGLCFGAAECWVKSRRLGRAVQAWNRGCRQRSEERRVGKECRCRWAAHRKRTKHQTFSPST